MYRDWTQGGDNSLYNVMHIRFKDIKTFEREAPRRSGSISPLKSDSNDETTSKSDAYASAHNSKAKSRGAAAKNRGRGKSGLEDISNSTEKFLKVKKVASDVKIDVALQCLEFERNQAEIASKIALEGHEMRTESQKRKWKMIEQQEEDAKRRRTHEEMIAQEKRILERVEKLNKFISETTNANLIEAYQKLIDLALAELPQL
ncbi:hypothetical protein FRC06_002516 [Ceratobasidium sp. 370]|nr:hypothetical protein FRC06_002516 [Ceratobasidium sp. 370]